MIQGLPPSGDQHVIAHGGQQVVITEVGATLRSYTVDDVDIVDGFDSTEMCSAGRGQILAPWPNRLDAGRYTYERREGSASLNEPEKGNAIHGLVRWLGWSTIARATDSVTLGCRLSAQPGYPWWLDVETTYSLDSDGLSVTTQVRNLSDARAPFGLGFHPYVAVGSQHANAVRLTVPATRRLVADDRGLPVRSEPVTGTAFDFSTGRQLGDSELDTAFTGLAASADGRVYVAVQRPDRRTPVSVWCGPLFKYVMVYTGDTLEPMSRRREGIAIEPMTCPPNALRTGEDLIVIEPHETWTATWGISP